MLRGLGNLSELMQQAQTIMGGKMQELNAQRKSQRVVGTAGAGLVEVEANGLGDVLAVRIDPTLIEKQDRELLEDLLPAACNAAQEKVQQLHAEQLQELSGGLNMPGLSEALAQFGGSPPSA